MEFCTTSGDHDPSSGWTATRHPPTVHRMRNPFIPLRTLVALVASLAALSSPSRAADAPKAITLFDGKSLDDWQTVDIGGSGEVELENGALVIKQGDSVSGAIYKKADKLPVTNYEITLEARRTQGVDFFCGLTFPVGSVKTCATLVIGGWGGSVTGISSIDGLDAAENSTGTYQRYKDNEWYKIKLRVTPKNLSAWVNDKQVIDADIEGKKISVRPGPIESYLPLSLTTFATTAEVKNVVLTPIVEKK